MLSIFFISIDGVFGVFMLILASIMEIGNGNPKHNLISFALLLLGRVGSILVSFIRKESLLELSRGICSKACLKLRP